MPNKFKLKLWWQSKQRENDKAVKPRAPRSPTTSEGFRVRQSGTAKPSSQCSKLSLRCKAKAVTVFRSWCVTGGGGQESQPEYCAHGVRQLEAKGLSPEPSTEARSLPCKEMSTDDQFGQRAAKLTNKSVEELTPLFAQVGVCRQKKVRERILPSSSSVSQDIHDTHRQNDNDNDNDTLRQGQQHQSETWPYGLE